MEELLTLLGPLGSPVSLTGLILFMYAYLRKQEAQVVTDLKQTIDRQKEEIESLVKDENEMTSKLKEVRQENADHVMRIAVLEAEVKIMKMQTSNTKGE